MIKTAEELQTENQEGKSTLVEQVEVQGLTKALQVMKYDEKYFVGFMGAMMTEPNENKQKVIETAKMFNEEEYNLFFNIVTHMIKNRELITKINNKNE